MVVDNFPEQHLGREAALAVRAVAEAVDLVREVEQDVAADALSKRDASPVTVADFSVQALLAARLGRDFPSDTLVAEEDAAALRKAPDLSTRVIDVVRRAHPGLRADQVLDWIDRGGGSPGQRFWALDPIDGTRGLLRGGQYAVALALIVDGTVRLGVLGCPRLSPTRRPLNGQGAPGEEGTAVAVRGRGSWWLARSDRSLTPLSVSDVSDPAQAGVLHSFEATHSDVDSLRRVVERLHLERAPCLMDSQAKHVLVASGAADALVRFPTRQDVTMRSGIRPPVPSRLRKPAVA